MSIKKHNLESKGRSNIEAANDLTVYGIINDADSHLILTSSQGQVTVSGSLNVIGSLTQNGAAIAAAGSVPSRPVSHKTTDFTITTALSGTFFTNKAAAAAITASLPLASASLEYHFYVHAGQPLHIKASGSDTINVVGIMTTAGGYVESATTGSLVKVLSIGDTEWISEVSLGSWSVG